MERWFTTAKLVVLTMFLAVTAGMVGYQMLYVWPAERCEKQGAWWDQRDRECLSPIPIERFTGRDFSAYKAVPASPAPATKPAAR
ncbi:MAG TPA: hypothetical protein VGF33_12170 [Caulobacteraceae bacterium]|jgi:hypothetical protein